MVKIAFVKYTGTGRSYAPKVSLSVSGAISFNEGTTRRYVLDSFEYCVLYYDPELKRIGIELTNDAEAEGARKLQQRQTGAHVAARSFIDFFGLDVEQTCSYRLTRDEETGYLTFDLMSGKPRKTSKDSEEKQLEE